MQQRTTSTVLWTLIGLNAILLFMFAGRATSLSTARAQSHRPADYMLIPGEVPGGSAEVVYILDTTNGKLGAMAYDEPREKLDVMPPIDLNSVYGDQSIQH